MENDIVAIAVFECIRAVQDPHLRVEPSQILVVRFDESREYPIAVVEFGDAAALQAFGKYMDHFTLHHSPYHVSSDGEDALKPAPRPGHRKRDLQVLP